MTINAESWHRRQQMKEAYTDLYDDLLAIIFRHDPVGICGETNTDEYDPEVGSILPRLREAHSAADVCGIVHEEFVAWFGGTIAGPTCAAVKGMYFVQKHAQAGGEWRCCGKQGVAGGPGTWG